MQRLKLGSTVRNLLVDAAIFGGFLLATDPHATGQAIHEWLGIAFGATIIVHLLLHWKWIVNVVRRFFTRVAGAGQDQFTAEQPVVHRCDAHHFLRHHDLEGGVEHAGPQWQPRYDLALAAQHRDECSAGSGGAARGPALEVDRERSSATCGSRCLVAGRASKRSPR